MSDLCGTLFYIAPEVLQIEAKYSNKVDIWSAGVITYSLLTGRFPFDGENDQETYEMILKADHIYYHT